MTSSRSHLTNTSDSGDQQLPEELVLHRHLREEVVDLIIISIRAVLPFSDHISEDETGL